MAKKKLKNFHYYRREWLNKPDYHTTAFIYASIRKGSYKDIQFTIADCDRQISLSFSNRGKEFKNSIHKLNTMIDVLTEFKEELTALETKAHDEDD